jgi:uncharacterized membrane protein (DUF2068 family)
MNKYKLSAIILIIHGGFMELLGCFAIIPVLLIGSDKFDIGQYFSFKLTYFQENLYLMIVMGAIYGVIRVIAAIGILNNKMWGLVLAIIVSIITIVLMMFLLPAGIMDGIFSSTVLILILTKFYGDKKIIE